MKKTALDDDASIYQPREEESEKQKWSRMDQGQRIQYFFDYYLLKMIIGIGLFAVIGYLIWSFVKPKDETVLCVAFIDEQLDEKKKEELTEELNRLCQADGKKKKVMIDDAFYMQDGGLSKLEVYLYNQQADIIIAEEDTWKRLAGYGFFQNMNEFLDEKSIKTYEKQYVFASGYKETEEVSMEDTETGQGKELPYGVSISESSRFRDIKNHLERPVLAVADNAPNGENAKKFLDYLLENKVRE